MSSIQIVTNGWRLGVRAYEASPVYNHKCLYEATNVFAVIKLAKQPLVRVRL